MATSLAIAIAIAGAIGAAASSAGATVASGACRRAEAGAFIGFAAGFAVAAVIAGANIMSAAMAYLNPSHWSLFFLGAAVIAVAVAAVAAAILGSLTAWISPTDARRIASERADAIAADAGAAAPIVAIWRRLARIGQPTATDFLYAAADARWQATSDKPQGRRLLAAIRRIRRAELPPRRI